MNERMSLERFGGLADAYGGIVARWPESVREAAEQMATQPAAIAILARASALDDALDTWAIPAASGVFLDRVLASAPFPARNIARRAPLWWSGVGIAAALAGAAAGAVTVAMIPPVDTSSSGNTLFGDVGPQES